MFDSYMGVIQALGFQFAPQNWGYCAGAYIKISQNTALYSLLGSIYGGDDRTVFALPDLRGRVPVGQFQGPGLSARMMGQYLGGEGGKLPLSMLPSHSHGHSYGGQNTDTNIEVSTQLGINQTPAAGDYLGVAANSFGSASSKVYAASGTAPQVALAGLNVDQGEGFYSNGLVIHPAGNHSPDPVYFNQPTQVINYCICMNGYYPSRS